MNSRKPLLIAHSLSKMDSGNSSDTKLASEIGDIPARPLNVFEDLYDEYVLY